MLLLKAGPYQRHQVQIIATAEALRRTPPLVEPAPRDTKRLV